jgi:hypothetical protein
MSPNSVMPATVAISFKIALVITRIVLVTLRTPGPGVTHDWHRHLLETGTTSVYYHGMRPACIVSAYQMSARVAIQPQVRAIWEVQGERS